MADRTLMPGDVVRRMTKGESQRGYCREIFVRADVKLVGTRYIARNVSSERLKPLITMPRDNAVCLDSWVGSTKSINERLLLRSACGSVVEVRPDNDHCPLKDADTKSRAGFFATTSFYPGQTLVGPVSELENAKWLKTSAEMQKSRRKTVDRKFVVQSVDIEGVWVNWQCKASTDEMVIDATKEGNGIQQPKCYVTGDDLQRMKRLNLYESCMLQINDKNFLRIEADDVIVRKSTWKKEQNRRFRVLRDQQQHKTQTLTVPDCAHKPAPHPHADDDTAADAGNDDITSTAVVVVITQDKERLMTEKQTQLAASDEWQTDDDENGSEDSNTTVSSCSSSATPKSSPRKSPLLADRVRKLKKRSSSDKAAADIVSPPKAGDEVVTEALVVYSNATVVW